MLASSSRRESRTENRQAKKVGCMSGIFYFFHMHRHNSRKRLSAGKKDSKTTTVSLPATPAPPPENPKPAAAEPIKKTPQKRDGPTETPAPAVAAASPASSRQPRRFSCDAPRSPTLSSEIRCSNSKGSHRGPPALVARLMGLDDTPPPSPAVSAAEKRRKLLGALERCDDDLRALKNIIEALRSAEIGKALAVGVDGDGGPATPKCSDGGDSRVKDKRCLEIDGEQPSPVSVLDALSSPPARRCSTGSSTGRGNQRGLAAPAVRSKQALRQVAAPLHAGNHEKSARNVVDGQHPLIHWNTKMKALPRPATGRKAEWRTQKGTMRRPWRLPCSTAMAESVDEVWEDGVWEERWELGRVGVALEGGILGDLVGEVVKELGFPRCRFPLPFDACGKRLCF